MQFSTLNSKKQVRKCSEVTKGLKINDKDPHRGYIFNVSDLLHPVNKSCFPSKAVRTHTEVSQALRKLRSSQKVAKLPEPWERQHKPVILTKDNSYKQTNFSFRTSSFQIRFFTSTVVLCFRAEAQSRTQSYLASLSVRLGSHLALSLFPWC